MNSMRRSLDLAEQRMLAAQSSLRASATASRAGWSEHRTAALLSGGFATGLALALLPVHWWSRAGGFAFRAGAHLARSSWLPAAIVRCVKILRS